MKNNYEKKSCLPNKRRPRRGCSAFAALAVFFTLAGGASFAAQEKSVGLEDIKQEVGKLTEIYDRAASHVATLEQAKDISGEAANLVQFTKAFLEINTPGSQSVAAKGLFKAIDEGEARLKKTIAGLEEKSREPGLDPDLRRSISDFTESPRNSLAELAALRGHALARRESIADFKIFCAQLIDVYEKLRVVDEAMAKESIRSAVKKKLQTMKTSAVAPQAEIKVGGEGGANQTSIFAEGAANSAPDTSDKQSTAVVASPRRFVPGVYEVGELERAPVPRLQGRPQYPFEARRSGLAGEVVIDCLIDAEGDVSDVIVVSSSHKVFEAAAVAAVLKWKFRPGRRGGQWVITRMQFPIVFQLNED